MEVSGDGGVVRVKRKCQGLTAQNKGSRECSQAIYHAVYFVDVAAARG